MRDGAAREERGNERLSGSELTLQRTEKWIDCTFSQKKKHVKFKPCRDLHSTGYDIWHSVTVLNMAYGTVSPYWI